MTNTGYYKKKTNLECPWLLCNTRRLRVQPHQIVADAKANFCAKSETQDSLTELSICYKRSFH